jgi:hypothetical protein
VSDKFYNPVEVPLLDSAPPPETGFVRIYGRRDGDEKGAFALFPDGTEKILSGGVVVVGAGDRDISYEESIDFSTGITLEQTVGDGHTISADAKFGPIELNDTMSPTDSATIESLEATVLDSLDVTTVANVELVATTDVTALPISDNNREFILTPNDSKSMSDSRGDASISGTNWADTVTSSTEFTATGNMTDQNDSSASILTAQQTALSGTVTEEGDITVSLGDPSLTPSPNITAVELQWGWATNVNGLLQTGNSLSINIEYSLDDGASFTNLETVTTVASSANNVLGITATYTELQQIRFRASGSVTSGTATALDAQQTFEFRYARATFSLTQSL